MSTVNPSSEALGGVPGAERRAEASAEARARRRRRLSGAWLRLVSPLLVLAGWQLISSLSLISTQKLPRRHKCGARP